MKILLPPTVRLAVHDQTPLQRSPDLIVVVKQPKILVPIFIFLSCSVFSTESYCQCYFSNAKCSQQIGESLNHFR